MTVDAGSDGLGQLLIEHGSVTHVQYVLFPSSGKLETEDVVVLGSSGGVDGRAEEGGTVATWMRKVRREIRHVTNTQTSQTSDTLIVTSVGVEVGDLSLSGSTGDS